MVAGARSFAGKEGRGEMGYALALDVTSRDSVEAFCAQAQALYGVPDALVCAAGIITFGPAETTTAEEVKAVLNTNYLGAVRMTREVLPLMRQQGKGKLVYISSVNGLMPTPYQGAYVSSKHALEGWAECLMLETGGQGVQVCLVEPGDHSGGSSLYRGSAKAVPSLYRESFQRACAVVARDEAQGQTPASFGRKLVKAVSRSRLPARLRATTLKETMAIVLHDLLPGRVFHKFLANYYKV